MVAPFKDNTTRWNCHRVKYCIENGAVGVILLPNKKQSSRTKAWLTTVACAADTCGCCWASEMLKLWPQQLPPVVSVTYDQGQELKAALAQATQSEAGSGSNEPSSSTEDTTQSDETQPQEGSSSSLASATAVVATIVVKSYPYARKSGTSMAVPHVTGVAARLWAAFPNCSNADIKEALYDSALDLGDLGKDNVYGWGLLQAEAAYYHLSQQHCARS